MTDRYAGFVCTYCPHISWHGESVPATLALARVAHAERAADNSGWVMAFDEPMRDDDAKGILTVAVRLGCQNVTPFPPAWGGPLDFRMRNGYVLAPEPPATLDLDVAAEWALRVTESRRLSALLAKGGA